MSGMVVDNVCVDVPIKFVGDSRSNGFRDTGGADFRVERTNIGVAYPNSAKRERVSPKDWTGREAYSGRSVYLSYVCLPPCVMGKRCKIAPGCI